MMLTIMDIAALCDIGRVQAGALCRTQTFPTPIRGGRGRLKTWQRDSVVIWLYLNRPHTIYTLDQIAAMIGQTRKAAAATINGTESIATVNGVTYWPAVTILETISHG